MPEQPFFEDDPELPKLDCKPSFQTPDHRPPLPIRALRPQLPQRTAHPPSAADHKPQPAAALPEAAESKHPRKTEERNELTSSFVKPQSHGEEFAEGAAAEDAIGCPTEHRT